MFVTAAMVRVLSEMVSMDGTVEPCGPPFRCPAFDFQQADLILTYFFRMRRGASVVWNHPISPMRDIAALLR